MMIMYLLNQLRYSRIQIIEKVKSNYMELVMGLFSWLGDILRLLISSYGFCFTVVIIYGMYLFHCRWKMKYKLYPKLDKEKLDAIDKSSLGKEFKFPKYFKTSKKLVKR